MALSIEQQLVLKAFQLGRQISQGSAPGADLAKVDDAIEQLERRSGSSDKELRRLLFYLLLRAEVLRKIEGVRAIRRRAMSVAEKLDSSAFDSYMSVVEETESRAQVRDGLGQGRIARGRVATTKTVIGGDKWRRFEAVRDLACDALEVDQHDFSDAEMRFIYDKTLDELLNYHELQAHERGEHERGEHERIDR
jgi:hypothetical protein